MSKRLQGLIAGILIGAMLMAGIGFAATGGVEKLLEYSDIKITLNNQEITPTDANGNYVEPFTIDGTTYLPVRAVANAMNLNVDWDGATNTVILSNKSAASQTAGEVVYDKNGIKITYIGFERVSYGYSDFKFMIENNTQGAITIITQNESVNGYMIEGIMYEDIQPGKKVNTELSFADEDLQKNNINSIESIEFLFSITNESYDLIDNSDIIKINL